MRFDNGIELGPEPLPGGLLVTARCETPLHSPYLNGSGETFSDAHRLLADADYRLTAEAARELALRGGGLTALASLVARGDLVVLTRGVPMPAGAGPGGRDREGTESTPEPGAGGPGGPEETHWIKIQIVDDASGEPIPGVRLCVTHPNERQREYDTRADGMVAIEEIDAGVCDVTCKLNGARLEATLDFVSSGDAVAQRYSSGRRPKLPKDFALRVARIESHKVQTGETLDSLARGAGLTWQELAKFNWGTSIPEEINRFLYEYVGCAKKTADGKNFMFTSQDDPGLVYIPRPWSAEDLATDTTHIFRVRMVHPKRLKHWDFSI